MASRYGTRRIKENNDDMYRSAFKKRGLKSITHYETNFTKKMSPQFKSKLRVLDHIWRRGDHFYKLSSEYYGSPEYWWIIAAYNYAPTESKIKFGDTIFIPLPLETLLSFYRI